MPATLFASMRNGKRRARGRSYGEGHRRAAWRGDVARCLLGGGRGFRTAADASELQPALESATREARSAFGGG